MKRALEFRGALDLSLMTGVVPVVLVNDATRPGYRALVERAWMYAELVTSGVGIWPHFAIKAPANRSILVESVFVKVGASNDFSIGLLGPNDADPWVINQLNIRWTERLSATTEITGILSAPQTADAVQYGIPIFTDTGEPTNAIWHPVDVVLEPNAKLIVQGHAQTLKCTFGFKGRAL